MLEGLHPAVEDGALPLNELKGRRAPLNQRRQTLEAELAVFQQGPARRLPRIDVGALRQALTEWRGLLQQAPAVARQLLRKLLPEPLTLTRTADGRINFRGRIATAALLAGVAGVMALVPPGCSAGPHTIALDEVIAA